MKFSACFILILLLGVTSMSSKAQKNGTVPDSAQLEKMTSRFAPTPLRVDTSRLSAGDRQALAKLIGASRVLNDVFLQQFWSGNESMHARLQLDTTPLGKERLEYFWISKGPWSDLDDLAAFVPGAPARKLPGAPAMPYALFPDVDSMSCASISMRSVQIMSTPHWASSFARSGSFTV